MSATRRLAQTARRIGAGTRVGENWFQLFRFTVVGASGYVINLVVFAATVEGLGLYHGLGAIIAFGFAVSSNFFWNRRWTFTGSRGRVHRQARRFLIVSLVALAVNLACLELLVGVLGLPALAAQALAVAMATPINFMGNKLWTFSEGRATDSVEVSKDEKSSQVQPRGRRAPAGSSRAR